MIDREKVRKGLECCCSMTGEACRQCPYDEECAEMIGSGSAHLCADALELLNKQQEQKFFVDIDGKITPLQKQKHGNWVPIKSPTGVEYGGFKEYTVQEVMCSECGFTDDVSASIYTYCPECGAKMDGKVKQDETD